MLQDNRHLFITSPISSSALKQNCTEIALSYSAALKEPILLCLVPGMGQSQHSCEWKEQGTSAPGAWTQLGADLLIPSYGELSLCPRYTSFLLHAHLTAGRLNRCHSKVAFDPQNPLSLCLALRGVSQWGTKRCHLPVNWTNRMWSPSQ